MTGAFDHLETDLAEKPMFVCEQPDGRKDLSEHQRQSMFVAFMRKANPHIVVYANMNHGQRGQIKAVREGLVGGVFDMTICWEIAEGDNRATVAWAEFKSCDKNGRAGKLSPLQIEWGNRMMRLGYPVGCFFSARTLVEWLRGLGAPVRGRFT